MFLFVFFSFLFLFFGSQKGFSKTYLIAFPPLTTLLGSIRLLGSSLTPGLLTPGSWACLAVPGPVEREQRRGWGKAGIRRGPGNIFGYGQIKNKYIFTTTWVGGMAPSSPGVPDVFVLSRKRRWDEIRFSTQLTTII